MGLFGKSAEAWNNEGRVLLNLGRYQEAIQCFEKAIEINLNHASAWCGKGVALRNLGRTQEAIQCYDRAITIFPNDTVTWSNKGYALYKQNLYEEAIQCYDRAIAIDPKYVDARKNKELAMSRLAEREEKAREEEARQAEKERLRKDGVEQAEKERLHTEREEQVEKALQAAIEQLSSAIIILMPEFIDTGTAVEIVADMKNSGDKTLTDIRIDLGSLKEDFEIEGELAIKTLSPGKAVKMRVKIRPKFDEGIFPVKVWICSGDVRVEKEYTIKVGGTEIY